MSMSELLLLVVMMMMMMVMSVLWMCPPFSGAEARAAASKEAED